MTNEKDTKDIIEAADYSVQPYAKRYSLSAEDAEDLKSDCILKVYQVFWKYDSNKGTVKNFANKIIEDVLRDWERGVAKENETFTPMTDGIEDAHMNMIAPQEISDADEFECATQELMRGTIQSLPDEARQFFEDFLNLEMLTHKEKKPSLNVLRAYYLMGRSKFYGALWPDMLDKFNDAFYVACKDDPDILAWFLRKFLEGQRREDDKKRFIKNSKKGN